MDELPLDTAAAEHVHYATDPERHRRVCPA